MVMRQLESQLRERQCKELEHDYLDCLARQKHHYMFIYFLLSFSISKLPEYYKTLLEPPTWSVCTSLIPLFDDIMTQIEGAEDKEVIECLTFSGLPCYFSYFFTSLGIGFFLTLMRRVAANAKFYYAFARIAFVSPLFLSFVSRVFRPLFASQTSANLADEIVKRWISHREFIPSFVVQLLRDSSDPSRLLLESFFKLGLDESSLPVFCFIPFYQTVSHEFMSEVKLSIFSILGKLVEATLQSTSSEVPVLDETATRTPLLFHRLMYSTLDHNCYAALDIHGGLAPVYLYEVIASTHVQHKDLNAMRERRIETAALRTLLEESDPLPAFVEPDISLRDYFLTYLVKAGPLDGYSKRLEAFEEFDKSANWANIVDTFPENTADRRALSAFLETGQRYRRLDMISARAREEVEKVFVWRLLLPVFQGRCKTRGKYMLTPSRIFVDFQQLVPGKGVNRSVAEASRFRAEVAFGYIVADVKFGTWRDRKRTLKEVDGQIAQLIAAKKMETQEEFVEGFRMAATEQNPISKILLFTEVLQRVEERQWEAAIYGANPPCLASNLVFIRQFCLAPAYDEKFMEDARRPFALIAGIVKTLVGKTPEDLAAA
jgi:hypothetical protein